MLIAGAMQAVVDALGSLTFFIDKGVYTLAKAVYDVFMFIADARLLDDTIAINLTRRIYAVLSLFMLFVLAYNLLMYIIDPDKMLDKKNGLGSIIKDVVIALVVIILLPTIFNRLYSLQSLVLKSGVIENIFLGGYTEVTKEELGNASDPSAKSGVEKGVNIMIANTYAAFLLPDSENNFTVLQCDSDEAGDYEYYCNAWKNVKETGNIAYYANFVGDDDYKFFPLVSTIVGFILVFFTLSFCLNLAIRAAKLAVLQVIAPIPFILEILPNKKGTRSNWITEVKNTYLEVFIYMAMIFLVIFLISIVPNAVNSLISATLKSDVRASAGTFTSLVAVIIISFGLLQFGKEAPKYVLGVLNIQSKGILAAAGIRASKMAGSGLAGIATAGVLGKRAIGNTYRDFKAGDNGATSALRNFGKFAAGAGAGVAYGMYNNRTGGLRNAFKSAGSSAGKVETRVDKASAVVGEKAGAAAARAGKFNEFMKGDYTLFDQEGRAQFAEVFKKGEDSDARNDAMISMLEAIPQRKDYAKEDDDYKGYNDAYKAEKATSNYGDVFEAWKASNPGKKEVDFVNEIKAAANRMETVNSDGSVTPAGTFMIGNKQYNAKDYIKAANAYANKEARKNELITDKKKDNIRQDAWKTIEDIRQNPKFDLNSIDITLDDGTQSKIKDNYEELRSYFDDKGNLVAGKSTIDLDKTYDELTKQITKVKNKRISDRSAAKTTREAAAKFGRRTNSSNNDNKDNK